jgi:tetratricopeptide (TPR) repeat protein
MNLEPLSREAIRQLAHRTAADADADELYRRTGGNPFFAAEVLAASGQEIPRTVRDAILARVARLSTEARATLQAAAAVGARVEPALLAKVLEAHGTPRWGIQETVNTGLLELRGGWLAFRHELAQAAIAGSTPAELRQRLHATILSDLRAGSIGPDDYLALVDHAEAADDDRAVLELAPRAAARSAALGAHRQAAELYGKAAQRARGRPRLQADLLERRGDEHYLSRRFEQASGDHGLAARLCRDLGDHLGEARNLIRVSYLSLAAGDRAGSEAALASATALLEDLPPSRELAVAYEARGRWLFMSNEPDQAAALAERALAVARGLGDPQLALDAELTTSAARLMAGDDSARHRVRELQRAARDLARGAAPGVDSYARATFYLVLLADAAPLLRRRRPLPGRGIAVCGRPGSGVLAEHDGGRPGASPPGRRPVG